LSETQTIAISSHAQFAPCDVTEQEAFDFYRRLEKPTPGAVSQHFRELGRKLSRSKVEKWAREGKWRAKLDLASANSSTDRDAMLKELAQLGDHPAEGIKRGLGCLLLLRMAREIDHVKVETVKDLVDAHNLACELEKASSVTQMKGRTGAPESVIRFAPFKPVNRGE
jgi:hypothetical protein